MILGLEIRGAEFSGTVRVFGRLVEAIVALKFVMGDL